MNEVLSMVAEHDHDRRSGQCLCRRDRQVRSSGRWLERLCRFVVVGIVATVGVVQAQAPDTAQPLKPRYGIGTDEFLIGAAFAKWWSPDDPVRVAMLWTVSHDEGLNVLYGSWDPFRLTDMLASTHLWSGSDRIVINGAGSGPRWSSAGFGRELEFYPWDSSQSSYYIWKFASVAGVGTEQMNTNSEGTFQEQRLSPTGADSVPANTLLARNPVIDWNPKQVYRYPPHDPMGPDSLLGLDSVQTISAWRDLAEYRHDFWLPNGHIHDTCYLVVKGHLSDSLNTSVDSSTPLIGVAIYYQIPKKKKYVNSSGSLVMATANTEILIDSFAVRKDSLLPLPGKAYNDYREISFPFSTWRCKDGTSGPWEPRSESKEFDVRVYYLGHEQVFLRAVALRDSLGELVLGTSSQDVAFRNAAITEAALWLRDTAGLRANVIGLESGTEPNPQEFAGYEKMNKLIRSNFNRGTAVGDSVPAFIYDLAEPTFHRHATPDEVYIETYLSDPRDTVPGFGSDWNPGFTPRRVFETPHRALPSIVEHNGGRGHIEIMPETRAGIDSFEVTLQRGYVGKNVQGVGVLGGIAGVLNKGASESRRTGRRFIQVPGVIAHLELRGRAFQDTVGIDTVGGVPVPDLDSVFVRDTLFSHVPEASELRMLIGMGLCYGIHGVDWWRMQSSQDEAFQENGLGYTWWSFRDCCFGSNGLTATQNTENWVESFNVGTQDVFGNRQVRLTVPNFYVGWGDRTGAIRQMNFWLRSGLGAQMMRIRWRAGYSIHATVIDPERQSTENLEKDTLYRPLPSSEIVTRVTSRQPITGEVDSTWRTFVELGLFEAKGDTNYIAVCNRRTYEPIPDGVTDWRDTLAEQREIRLTLNLPYSHGDSALALYRVREMFPDTSRLPLTNVVREGLDTTISGHGTVVLRLGPGRSALLRIVPTAPSDNIVFGDMRTNNQRKFLFDGLRWHAVYHRRNANDHTPGENYDAKIYYRRSYPVDSTTGGVRWEPWETSISDSLVGSDTARHENRFPSMTMRVQGTNRVISIVWTAHYNPLTREREVMFRNIRYNTVLDPPTHTPKLWIEPMEHVWLHKGLDARQWGTPVICSLNGGDFIGWSDDSLGICGVVRRLAPAPWWWELWPTYPGSYTNVVLLSNFVFPGIGKYPTVPTFANIDSRDSVVGVSWMQDIVPGRTSVIAYQQVQQQPAPAPPATLAVVKVNNPRIISGTSGRQAYPSCDGTQDYEHLVQEGVVWESPGYGVTVQSVPGGQTVVPTAETWLNYRSIRTETRQRGLATYGTYHGSQWDLINPSEEVGPVRKYRVLSVGPVYQTPYAPPTHFAARANIASMNEVSSFGVDTLAATFSVVANPYDEISPSYGQSDQMVNLRIPYYSGLVEGPRLYTWGGLYPNGSASWRSQSGRFAALFEKHDAGAPPDSLLTTTREHFAKARPRGYVATGREVEFRLDTSLQASINGYLLDVWMADDSLSVPLAMVDRPSALYATNGMSTVDQLMRTKMFSGHDSVVIGCEVHGAFAGDTSVAGVVAIRFVVELVDSATGGVVHQLDSFEISRADTLHVFHATAIVDTVDLLSGTYYVRMREECDSLPGVVVPSMPMLSLYPVSELSSYVSEPTGAGKLRRESGEVSGLARVESWPNPISDGAELRFSVVESGETALRVYDGMGRLVAEPVREWMEPGRYAIELDTRGWSAGTYTVELVNGSGGGTPGSGAGSARRATTRVVVIR